MCAILKNGHSNYVFLFANESVWMVPQFKI